MEWIFSVGTIVVVIGVIVSSIKKVMASSNKTTHNSQNDQPSAEKSGGVDLFDEIKNAAAKNAAAKNAAAKQKSPEKRIDSHTHPAAASSLRIEKAVVEDSMGAFQSEGCAEHYYDRFVTIPEKPKDKKINEELAKIIVLGEVLNNPGFKKHRRK